jgi:molybdenum cofactor biosynthesis protein B
VHREHRRDQKINTCFAFLTVTDSRTKESDESGKVGQELIKAQGHEIIEYDLVTNDPEKLTERIDSYLGNPKIRVIVVSGGTGVGRHDVTVQTLVPKFEKTLVGFGELFRRISYDDIGIAGVYSQAVAGLIGATVIYCLPGSKNAMVTALSKIILPGIGHLIWEIDR